jgi:flavin-dependent trigonelline monooxygenase, reductase component
LSSAAQILDPESWPSLEPDRFREACSRFATGVAIATVRAQDGEPRGMTVSSFTPVSIQPPLVLVCIDFSSSEHPHFRSNTHFAVSVLSEDQAELSVRFSGQPDGRFEGVDWYPGTTGAPLLRCALAIFECRVRETVEAGDHAILIGEVICVGSREGKPLIYFNRNYRVLE